MAMFKVEGYRLYLKNCIPREGHILLNTEPYVGINNISVKFVERWDSDSVKYVGNKVEVLYKFEHFDRFVDILRNEKPIYIICDDKGQNLNRCMLTTGANEPVGEAE